MTCDRIYEVRCCCVPRKVLGWLELPQTDRETVFKVTEKTDFAEFLSAGVSHEEPVLEKAPVHEVRIRTININGEDRLAVYSEDRGIDFWRKIRGFTENK